MSFAQVIVQLRTEAKSCMIHKNMCQDASMKEYWSGREAGCLLAADILEHALDLKNKDG